MLLVLLILLVCLYIAIQIPSVQNYAKSKILSSLSKQYNAKWTIDDLHIDFLDEATATGILFLDQQNDTLLSAESLHIDIGIFSLLGKEIDIDEIKLTGTTSRIYELEDGRMNFDFLLAPSTDQKKTSSKTSNNEPWSIHIDDVIALRSDILYKTTNQELKFTNDELNIFINSIDLLNKKIDVNTLEIASADVKYNTQPSEEEGDPFTLPDIGWNIVASDFDISSSNIKYSSGSQAHNIEKLNVAIDDMTYGSNGLALLLDQSSLRYNDTLDIKNLSTQLSMAGDTVELDDLAINTPNDKIKIDKLSYVISANNIKSENINIHADYKTISALKALLPDNINIKKGAHLNLIAGSFNYINQKISGQEIQLDYGKIIEAKANIQELEFMPNGNISVNANISSLTADIKSTDELFKSFALADSLRKYEQIQMSGSVTGDLNNLNVKNLNINIDEALNASFDGKINNIANESELRLDVNINKLQSSMNQLPIPANEGLALDSLGKLSFTGKIRGTQSNINISGDFNTDLGALSTDIALQIPADIKDISYKGNVNLDKFQLGTFLKNDDLSVISLTTDIDGKGLDFENIDTAIKGEIKDFAYRDYQYANINLNADISESQVDGKISIDDKNVKLSYDGKINIEPGKSIFDFTASIDTINLKELGLYTDSLSVSGKIQSQFSIPLSSGETGEVTISDLYLSNPRETFYEDTISIIAAKKQDSTHVDMRSDFLSMDIDGKYKIREIPPLFTTAINHFYSIDSVDSEQVIESDHVNISGTLYTLQPIDVVLGKSFVQAKQLSVNIDTRREPPSLDGKIVIDSFYYDNNFSEQINITLATDGDQLQLDTKADNNLVANTEVPILNLLNSIQNSTVSTTLLAADEDKLPKLKISTELIKTDETITVSLEDSLVLNKKDWTANEDNKIEIFDNKILINRLRLTDTNESLTISSISDEGNDFEANFENFNIGQFATLMTGDTSMLSGEMNGSLELRDYNEDFYYLIDINVDDIIYDSTFVGEMILQASEKKDSDEVNANFYLIGPNNDVSGGGKYNTSTDDLNINLDVNSLQMMLLDPFMSSFITDSKGVLSGAATLEGKPSEPIINGSLTLKDVTTNIVANNTSYGINDHTITFDNNSIDIGTLDIFDKQNNTATLSGKIYHSFLDDIRLDLSMDTDKFSFLNTGASENPVFYGNLMLSADADITGSISLLNIDINAKTLESSAITISPFAASTVILEEDFVKYGKPDDYQDLTKKYLLQLSRKFPFKVNLLLDATKEAKLNLVIDPVTGDKIEGVGDGNLRIKLNPDGTQEIYGQYTVREGSYSFSYGDFVNKEFAINSGGTVRFNGDPLNAILDIDAIYTAYTTTYELIKNEISIDDTEINNAQKRTDVNVYLSLQGSLEDPQIVLDIKIPNLESSNLVSAIDRKLNELRNDPNEMNNQVFGLLLFNSFILSESASSGFNNFGSNIALSSISSLISNQLNKFADNIIKGVDVNLSVNSYDSSYANGGGGGNVTEVGLEVSKQLFNDRLSLSAGGNFDLAGTGAPSSYSSFIGDFVLEYKLTQNGRYRVRVFSKSAYDRLLDENSNRNGVSLFFNKTFDSKTDGK